MSAEARFWAKVEKTASCWLWKGATKKPSARDARGGQSLPHGVFWYEGRTVGAHRISCSWATGIPLGELGLVSHACDNPRCVNPSHLSESTFSDNLKEAHARGRREPHLASLCAWFDANPIREGVVP